MGARNFITAVEEAVLGSLEELTDGLAAQIRQNADLYDEVRKRRTEGLLGSDNGACARTNGGVEQLSTTKTRAELVRASAEAEPNPRTTTVTLYRRNLEDAPVGSNFIVRAFIRWGAGKSMQKLTCDFHHGTRFTLDASSVQIEAQYLTGDGAALVGPAVEVAASIVYGNISSKNLTFTDERFTLLAGVTLAPARDIPDFARQLTLFSDSPIGASPTVTFLADKAAAAVSTSTVPFGTPMVIPNGVESWQVQNNNAFGQVFVPVFDLNV